LPPKAWSIIGSPIRYKLDFYPIIFPNSTTKKIKAGNR